MNQGRFDRITRVMATASSRRGALKSLAASAVGVGAFGLAASSRRASALAAMIPSATSEERGVLFYELFAATLDGEGGTCDHLAQVADQFRNDNKALFTEILTEEQAWTPEKKTAVEAQYSDRIGAATKSLALSMSRCDYLQNSSSPLCAAGGDGGTPVAEASRMSWTAAQTDAGDPMAGCSGCDCNCICPISAGKCAGFWFGCLAGTHSACCWSGACTGSCTDTCNDSQCCQYVH